MVRPDPKVVQSLKWEAVGSSGVLHSYLKFRSLQHSIHFLSPSSFHLSFSLAPGFLSPLLLFPVSLSPFYFHRDSLPSCPFLLVFSPLPSASSVPHSFIPRLFSKYKRHSSSREQSHPLFHYQMGGPKQQPKSPPGPAVPLLWGVGPGLHRRAALNDKRGY
jgi:hypothetical protein